MISVAGACTLTGSECRGQCDVPASIHELTQAPTRPRGTCHCASALAAAMMVPAAAAAVTSLLLLVVVKFETPSQAPADHMSLRVTHTGTHWQLQLEGQVERQSVRVTRLHRRFRVGKFDLRGLSEGLVET